MNDMIETGTALMVVPAASLPTILAADENDIFGKLFVELKDFRGDPSTERGRKEIISKAAKVSTAKQDLLRLGKKLKEDHLRIQKSIIAEEKVIEDRFDALRDQVRAPVTEYENRDKLRIAAHERALAGIEETYAGVDENFTSDTIAERLDALADIANRAYDWQEFSARARNAFDQADHLLRLACQHAQNREDEAEAARIATEEETQRQAALAVIAQREREERIAREAAEAARIAAEERAAREAREAEEKAQALLKAAEHAAEAERLAAALREKEAAEALAKAQAERLAGIERERVAAEKAEASRIEAHHARIDEISERPEWVQNGSSAEIARYGRSLLVQRDWEEFASNAQVAIDAAVIWTRGCLATAMVRETEQLNAERIAAEAQTKADQAAAIKAEQDRVARVAAAQKAADDKRAADVAHRRKINQEAVADLMQFAQWPQGTPLAEALARLIVTVVAKGEIRHLKVEY